MRKYAFFINTNVQKHHLLLYLIDYQSLLEIQGDVILNNFFYFVNSF